MQQFIEFFQSVQPGDWFHFAVVVVSLIFHIVSMILCYKGYHVFCKHDDNNKNLEVSNMKQRTPNYRENLTVEQKFAEGQTFSPLVKQFKLDKRSGELVELEPLDIQKLIDSSLDTALDRVLKRLMPDEQPQPTFADMTALSDDLDFMSEALDTAEEWREKLGLSDEISVGDVFQKMSEYEKQLAQQLNQINNQSEVKIDVK